MQTRFASVVTLAIVATLMSAHVWGQAAPPKLELAFEADVDVGAPEEVGAVAGGTRRLVPINGGSFSGPLLKGTILAGGSDSQILQTDGFTQIDARYVLQTTDGKKIYVVNRGIRYGSPEVLAKLNSGERVDPALIYFRTVAELQTAAPELTWMNHALFICVGERYPNKVVIRFYKLL
jgi:Protein of unknown function (DUF3237)